MNVYQRLNEARAKFHAMKLEKTGHNKFAGYKYFELGDFLIPALQVFAECGLCATVSFDKDIASLVIRNVEKPEDCAVITSPMASAALKGCHEVQNIGAVETYQRRYLWVAALEIVEHDALDATTGKDDGKKPIAGVIKATDGVEDMVSEDRKHELDHLAVDMIEAFKNGRQMDAVKWFYDPDSFTDNEERVYLWRCLSAESKLRAFIKSNNPNKAAA